jgi:hypothetical protein
MADFTLLHQDDVGIRKEIHNFGCFFMSACAIAQMHSMAVLSADQLNGLWDTAVAKHLIVDNNVVSSAGIINAAMEVLIREPKWCEVGTRKDELSYVVFYASVGASMKRVDAMIRKILQPPGSTYKNHFKVVDYSGNIVYDPWTKGISGKTVYDIAYAYKG